MISSVALDQEFTQLYSREPRIFSAPGRVNLIGEHTDYNEGFVLPFATNLRSFVAAAARDDNVVRVCSRTVGEQGEFRIGDRGTRQKSWLNHVEGIAHFLKQRGYQIKGADIVISSDLPIGAGLSSSAALEMSVGFAFLKLGENEIDLLALARSAQETEHHFIGTQSGLMDQLTIGFGVKDCALLIDCRSLDREVIPLQLPDIAVVLCDTKVKHDLATSAYNERRHQCEEAVRILRQIKPEVLSLRDVTMDDLKEHGELLPEEVFRRSRHVVSENERVLQAAETLRQHDVKALGELMNRSHESLRYDYEVSCDELDLLVDLARTEPGVFGARMMGGGFGGSTVNLVQRNYLDRFSEKVFGGYWKATGVEPAIMEVAADDGVSELL